MRKTIATALVLVGTTGAALAADLPARTAPVYAPPLPPVFTWSGGYIGINAGYAFDYSSRFAITSNTSPEAAGVRPSPVRAGGDGFTGGGQIGYNYQFGAGNGVVVGVEADAAYTDTGRTRYYFGSTGLLTQVHSDMDFLGTVRGRLGYAFDRFMVYGTGGFAYGDVTSRGRFFTANGVTPAYVGSYSDIDTGYAYGGGIEYAVPTGSFLNSLNFFHSSAVTVKAEYLHYDLGSHTQTLTSTPAGGGGAYTQRVRTDGDLVRVGVNYKF